MKTIQPPRFNVVAYVSNEECGENVDSVGCYGFGTFAAALRYANSPGFNLQYNDLVAQARLEWNKPEFSGYITVDGSTSGLVCAEMNVHDNGFSWSRCWEL